MKKLTKKAISFIANFTRKQKLPSVQLILSAAFWFLVSTLAVYVSGLIILKLLIK